MPPTLAPVCAAMLWASRGSAMFSKNTAATFSRFTASMVRAMSRALASASVETPCGAINSNP